MKSAIITASSGKSVEEKKFNGVFSCLLEHEVKATKAQFEYTGPKISPNEWAQMMAFFEWTQATERSEAQVRLFVHPVHGWKAWAFPQKGGTGMTIKEIDDHPARAAQRAQFADHDGCLYFGTVHHHCTCSAFQSGTDSADEQSQDGLHITIGNMDKPDRDIHCRLYLKGHKFEPIMDAFWNIGEGITAKANEFKDLFGIMPDLDKTARRQMAKSSEILIATHGLTPPAEGFLFFPAQWKDNYIIDRPVVTQHHYEYDHRNSQSKYQSGNTWCHNCGKWSDHVVATCPNRIGGPTTAPKEEAKLTKRQRKELKKQQREQQLLTHPGDAMKLLDDLETVALCNGYDASEFFGFIEEMSTGEHAKLFGIMLEDLSNNSMTFEDLYDAMQEKITLAMRIEQAPEVNGNKVADDSWNYQG